MTTTLLPAPDSPAALTAPTPPAHGPLRVMFITTTLEVGGAETLLVNLVRRLDRRRITPEICCLKARGPLGDSLAGQLPMFERMLSNKFDVRVLDRLRRLLRRRRIDAVVTVGAGDKMFWGRLAARLAGVPVVAAALHSTGWPDGVGRLNRLLTPLTDAFIGVAAAHGRHLIEQERFPAERVHVIPNGIDTERFRPRPAAAALRSELGLAENGPVAGIVAALRPEKNHEMFLRVAARVRQEVPNATFLIVGDGTLRPGLERLAAELQLGSGVRFLGIRPDVPELLSLMDVMLLTSHVEANPVSILEAMAVGKPVVATRVGSVGEMVLDGQTGNLVEPGDEEAMAQHVVELFRSPQRAAALGAAGREQVVAHGSLERMVDGYEELLEELFERRRQAQ